MREPGSREHTVFTGTHQTEIRFCARGSMEAVNEAGEGSGVFGGSYALKAARVIPEDILFCVDVDGESMVEMKTTGRPMTRLDSIKQAILVFINAKLSINPDHRFAFAELSKSASWVRKEFSSEVESAVIALRLMSASSSSYSGQADLTNLFRLAAHEAKKSRAQNRILRVVLIYCRSAVKPQHQWVSTQKLFTLDVIYIHDKPGPDNCPQDVYDSLVDALEHVSEYEGFIYETGQGMRILLRYMCILLAHPQQRVPQDDMDIPKSLVKKSPAPDSGNGEEMVPVASQ